MKKFIIFSVAAVTIGGLVALYIHNQEPDTWRV